MRRIPPSALAPAEEASLSCQYDAEFYLLVSMLTNLQNTTMRMRNAIMMRYSTPLVANMSL